MLKLDKLSETTRSYPQLPAVTHGYLQLPTVTCNYLQLPAITHNYPQLPTITCKCIITISYSGNTWSKWVKPAGTNLWFRVFWVQIKNYPLNSIRNVHSNILFALFCYSKPKITRRNWMIYFFQVKLDDHGHILWYLIQDRKATNLFAWILRTSCSSEKYFWWKLIVWFISRNKTLYSKKGQGYNLVQFGKILYRTIAQHRLAHILSLHTPPLPLTDQPLSSLYKD